MFVLKLCEAVAPSYPLSLSHSHTHTRTHTHAHPKPPGSNVAAIAARVAPNATILSLDIQSKGYALDPVGGIVDAASAAPSDIIDAINWVIVQKTAFGICAINLSYGSGIEYTAPCKSNVIGVALAVARAAGVLPAVAAGNSGFKNGLAEPACAPAAVSVGSGEGRGQGCTSQRPPAVCLQHTGLYFFSAALQHSIASSSHTPH